MFTILTAWISERIITVTAVSVLTVAAVPTTLIIVSHDDHNTVAVVQPADEHSKLVLVSAVKKAGDDVIARLNSAESGCTTQVTQAVAKSKVAAKVQPQLVAAKSQVHSSVAPLVTAIKADQARFAHLKFVTPQDEENELEHLKLIEIIALGDGHATGTITVTCQTILITITQTINITIVQETPCTTRQERESD
jgi:Zn-dependent oligopeptidase